MRSRQYLRRLMTACLSALVMAALLAPAAPAHDQPSTTLDWADCGDGFQCATAKVPRSYAKPDKGSISLAVVRLPATDPSKRIGSLFVNFGGPGGTAVDTIKDIGKDLFASLNDRFDIVGFDPRGVGESSPSLDCKANQETQGVYRQPFMTTENLDVDALIAGDKSYIQRCLDLNKASGILPFASTADVARDMDLLREAVGDKKLNYLGYSYGSFLGATYVSLFPGHSRAIVLDGALNPDQYINDPLENLDRQTAGFERALGRFLQACAAHQDVCGGFGGDDPWSAFDQLIEQADVAPLPASGDDPRPVDGDDIRAGSALAMYAKELWPLLAQGLAEAKAGDGTTLRVLADAFYAWIDDETYDPGTDRYFLLSADEQRYPHDLNTFLRAGAQSFEDYDHAFWNHGYAELAWGLYPIRAREAFYGPFTTSPSDPTTLVVGNTYDPATPYKGAKQMVRQLGNARLLTMRGDGHTAYGGESACIDSAVDAYFEEGTLPTKGTVCPQDTPFALPQGVQAKTSQGAARKLLRELAPRVKEAGLP